MLFGTGTTSLLLSEMSISACKRKRRTERLAQIYGNLGFEKAGSVILRLLFHVNHGRIRIDTSLSRERLSRVLEQFGPCVDYSRTCDERKVTASATVCYRNATDNPKPNLRVEDRGREKVLSPAFRTLFTTRPTISLYGNAESNDSLKKQVRF